MRTTLLVAVSILAVAFAGCTEEPPKGEFSSTGNALVLDGAVDTFESQDFNNPYEQTGNTQLECAQDGQNLPNVQECDRPYTVMVLNFSNLPDPQAKAYSVSFYSESSGTQEDLGLLNVHNMGGIWMGEYTFDNTDDCAQSTDSDLCNKANMYDTVVLYLDDIKVASAALSSGSAFLFDDSLLGTTFTGSFTGKTLTLSVAGLGNETYEGWLISTDADGVATHEESFTVMNGDNEFVATKTLDKYSAVHIHVAGTKLNVAVGAI